MKIIDLHTMRHSAEHLMHQAVKELFPQIHLAMGPATDEGFYNDFDPQGVKVTEADFPKIEKRMRELINLDLPIIKMEISEKEARELFKDNPYKKEWIDGIVKEQKPISIYWTGKPNEKNSFVDLCSGPHVEKTGQIGPFKLLSIAGAYWHGDEKNKMLTRIYGTCFLTQEELDKYIWQKEEAKKRDHRKLGVELDLWTYSDLVGSGLPLFTQKGALVRRLINEFVESLQSKQGIAQVWTPQIAKADLFKKSGHYDKYRENMFSVKSNYSEEEFFLKPMNCPQHTQIFAGKPRSYKDLPIRMADFAMLYRDEKPGELLGLVRTRSFSQDDCHIFCREDQVEEEMHKALDMTKEIMETYGFSYKYRLSVSDPQHPEKYLGDRKTWEKAEKLCEKIIKERKISYFLGVGEAAFYAPKLDLIAMDSLGREWQLSTLQIDFFLPERFDLSYIDKDGLEKRPVMLHRAISGSPERLMAILIEHYAGALPIWLSPVQVIIIPITDKQLDYAQRINQQLAISNWRIEINDKSDPLGAKIRNAQLQKIPYMLIIGPKEETSHKISVRTRKGEDLGQMTVTDFMNLVKEDIEQKRNL